ncbi:LytTR family transcriptional regulator [Spirosoma taeanense]|uniref:LytTR family transcriptional regulator n=1 Tax=Spirosoma taeanense TaxID=2735870 RepID=A0A6M5Y8D1_9BACT|nr:LytTR family DNA-binding domain-containing protein [Spirosoma taeanense]QJW90159.1 LytTR family transcriptional regulator [Spirosoma taeanense]
METLLLPDFTYRRAVPVATIEYLEAVGNYTTVHLIGQKPMLVAVTLKRFAERLPDFLRIHKGILVNPAHIVAYRTRYVPTPFVRLSQDRRLPISRRQVSQLRPRLASFPLCTN